MRTIKNSDIVFQLDPKHVYIEDFNAKFYTVNEKDYYISYDSDDVITTTIGSAITYSLNLDWKHVRNIGKGVMNFKCINNIPDEHFPDGEYNSEYVEITDFFIDTFEVDPEEDDKSISERLDALEEGLADETTARTTADVALSSEISTLDAKVEEYRVYTTEAVAIEVSARTEADDTLSAAISTLDSKVEGYKTATDTAIANEASARTAADEALSGAVDTAIADFFDGAVYELSGTTHVINFYHGNTVKATIDATDFITDGMVDNVVISGGNLVITFNTDAGKQDISIPLTDIFNPESYYTKTDTDTLLAAKADTATTYTKTEVDGIVSGKADSSAVTAEITAAVSGKQDTLVSGTNIKTINNESLLGAGNLEVITDLSDYYTKTEVDGIVSGKADSSAVTEEITAAVSGKADSSAVTEEISAAVSGKADSSAVTTEITAAVSGKQDTLVSGTNIKTINNESILGSGNLNVITDLSDYYTKSETDGIVSGKADSSAVTEEISAAVSGKADSSAVTEEISAAVSGKADSSAVTEEISAAVSGKADTSAVTTAITAAISGKADLSYVENVEETIARSLTDLALSVDDVETSISGKADSSAVTAEISASVSGKQDTLVSGTNIKTINNTSLLGSGNIDIQGGSGTIDPTLDSGSTNAVANSAITTAINAVSGAVSGKQDTLVSGTNIKTINNTSLLGSGNISISGGNNVVSLTQAEYNALDPKDPDALYIITDATDFDVSNYYTKTETNAALSGKQDTLVSGTNIKTINNTSLLGSGNIDIQGGGKAVSGGTNISITTGETADTINCTLPISAGTNTNGKGIIVGDSECSASGKYAIAFGHNSDADGSYSFVCGSNSRSNAQMSFAFGDGCRADHDYTCSFGSRNYSTKLFQYMFGTNVRPKNQLEFGFGQYNVSSSASTTFGHSGNTMFSVGNGYDYSSTHNWHNAFEVRQNGDVYIPNTDDSSIIDAHPYSVYPMVRLQDTVTQTTANTAALGGLSLVKLTQAEYDALATKDSNTLYVIVG